MTRTAKPGAVQRARLYFDPAVPAWLDLIFAASAAGAFAAAGTLRNPQNMTPQALACIGLAAVCAVLAASLRCSVLRRKEGMERRLPLFSVILAHLAGLAVWKMTSFQHLEALPSWWFFLLRAICIGALCAWAAAHRPLMSLSARAAAFCEKHVNAPGSLFGAALLCIALLTCWYTPATLYASNPDFFYEPLPQLAARLSLRGLVFMASVWLFYCLANARLKPYLAAVAAWAAVSCLLFTFLATTDHNAMNGFLLANPASLKTPLAALVDIAVLLTAAAAVRLILRATKAVGKGSSALATLLQAASLALILMSAWHIAGAPNTPAPGKSLSAASRAPFLAATGLFRAAPWLLRPHIYDGGSWLNTQTASRSTH